MAFVDRNKEERFLSQHRDDTAENLGWACILGAAIMIGFLWQDTLVSTNSDKAISVRIFGALPVSALVWYLSRNLRFRRFINYISAFFWLSYACFTVAIFIIYEPGPYGLTSAAGLGSFLLILFGIFAFSNLRFWSSLLVGILILLVYTVSVAFCTKVVFVDFIMGDFLTAVTLMIGAATKTFFTDRARRRLFETSELLSESYDTVEQQVRERTTELQVTNMQLTNEITERKRVEEELRESEERYRLLANNMRDQVWITDLNLKPIYISPSVAKSRGYTFEEIAQLPLEKHLTATSFQTAMAFFGIEMPKALADPRYFLKHSLELEFYRKDGTTLWVETAFSLIRDENGKSLSLLGVGRDITERRHAEEELQNTLNSLRKAVSTTIQVLVAAIEARDPYTAGHQNRVADLACAIATEMGLPPEMIEGIHMAGCIHDIGKLSLPAEILSKPTKLSALEFALIKEHSQSGYEILKDVESPWPLAEMIYQHHERMDGSGYPRKLQGNVIIIEARILAVADVVEAMASNRPYRPSLGIDPALAEIEKNGGTIYDEAVVVACIRLFRGKNFQLEVT